MKRIILSLAVALSFGLTTSAQTDTLVVNNPETVSVITTGDTLNLSISGQKDNPGFFYTKSVVMDTDQQQVTKSSQNVGSSLGWDFSLLEQRNSTPQISLNLRSQLYAGWAIPLGTPSGMSFKGAKNLEAGLDIFQLKFLPRSAKWSASLDWGLQFNNYHLKNCMFTSPTEGTVNVKPFPADTKSCSSSFFTLSSNLMLMGHYHFGKSHQVGLGLGWQAQAMYHNYFKTKYTQSDDTRVTEMNELPLQKHQFFIKAEYMYDRAGFYLRFMPLPLLQKDKGPAFEQMSIGFQVKF